MDVWLSQMVAGWALFRVVTRSWRDGDSTEDRSYYKEAGSNSEHRKRVICGILCKLMSIPSYPSAKLCGVFRRMYQTAVAEHLASCA